MIHAAGESSPGSLPSDTHAVALFADSESDLLGLAEKLTKAGFEYTLIREPDLPYNNAAMALGVRPQARTPELKRLMRPFRLAK